MTFFFSESSLVTFPSCLSVFGFLGEFCRIIMKYPRYIIISFVRSVVQDVYDVRSDQTSLVLGSATQSKAFREISSCLGILSNRKLLNVALTRARYGLVCIGNRQGYKT